MVDLIELGANDLAAMLCSRVCHDLINPVGAINAGLEVLADPKQSAMHEGANDLIVGSARQASAKLEYARLAFGASSAAGTDFDTRECERVAKLFFANEKSDLDWAVTPMMLPKNKAKLLMNMLLICAMGVPRGGLVRVMVEGAPGMENFRIVGKGPKVLIPSKVEGLISGAPEEGVDARGIQPFYTGLLARMTSMGLAIAIEGDELVFTAQPVS